MLALGATLPAAAQDVALAQTRQQSVSVPAGPLTPALNRLAAQAGLQILFDAELAQGKTTRGVSGNLTPAEALDTVLAGTGLSARFAGGNQVVLGSDAEPIGDGDPLSDDTTFLDVITIFGSRTSNTLRDTSASVGVVGARAIEESQVRDFRDAFRRLGNVADAAWADSGFVIRGVNSEGLVPGGAPLASLYIDGVPQTTFGTRRGASGLWDVEQVEVYRGPQSTLSGRAAMAGAIYLKTKDPVFDKEAELSGTIGTDGLVGTAFMVNTPLADEQIALRISGAFERSKNDINYPTFESYDRYDEFVHATYYNLRGKILFEPSEMPDTRALLSYSFAHNDPYVRDIGGPGLGFDWSEERGDFDDPAFIEYRPTDTHNVGLEVTHDISDTLRFTSMSSFSHADASRYSANYGTPGETNDYHGHYKDLLVSQELRLNYDGDRLSWVGGVYGSYEYNTNEYERTLWDLRYQRQSNRDKTYNIAAFGEATYEFVPTWKVTLGGRIDYTSQDISRYLERTQPLTGPTNIMTDYTSDLSELNLVPKIGFSKDLGDAHTIGVTYSEGFRTGGSAYDSFNDTVYNYDPETASTYEIFYKGSFLDDRLTLNANVFYSEYENQQIRVRLDPADFSTQRIINAGSSEAWGFEIEPSFRVNDQFETFLSVGYAHTEFREFNDTTYGDLTGLPFPEAPEWTVGFGGRYSFLNGFYVGADAKYTSRQLSRLGNLPNDYLGSRWIVNAQAGYKADNWEINAFAENLLDEDYLTFIDNDIAATLGERRRFGLNVKAKF